ncbi:MAG: (Fe-S)-binding protein [Deltaproteobacteria bacterium]|nr:(Fe-S)-binding protein [Deltaproteobacteria bacterium]
MFERTMARRPKEKRADFVEKDNVIIHGVDISGHWNRMHSPREITSYDLSHLEQVTAVPGAESMGWCYQCAKCIGVCPVDNVGNYGPRKLFRLLQTGYDLINSPELWECTTCANCLRVCPKQVDMIKIMPALRAKAVMDGTAPNELQDMFKNASEYGNPMGESPRKRFRWTKDLPEDVAVKDLSKTPEEVDVLWFVGDYYAFHARGNDAAKAMARVFNRLGVNFGTLGNEEWTDGDSQRLAGEPGLFEMMAEHNIEQFSKQTFGKIVTSGPHALNALKNEYPRLGGQYNVEHYTQFLNHHLADLKKLLKNPFPHKVTFHDPCYLGRHNGEYDAPRALLGAVPGLKLNEMYRCKEQGYCCGGGGGGMWLDGFMADHVNMRLSENRVREAVSTGAEVLAVCCPYEVSRFEDAVKSSGNEGKLRVMDIIEILDQSMGG